MLSTDLPIQIVHQPQAGERWRDRCGPSWTVVVREIASKTVHFSYEKYPQSVFERPLETWHASFEPIPSAQEDDRPLQDTPSIRIPGQPQRGEHWRWRHKPDWVVRVEECTGTIVRYSYLSNEDTVFGLDFRSWQATFELVPEFN